MKINDHHAVFRIFLLPVLLFCVSIVSAQDAIGIRGGIDLSNYGNTFLTNSYKTKVTPSLGAVVRWQKLEWFSYQVELNFDVKGANYTRVQKSESGITTTSKGFEESLNYIDIPVTARFDIGRTGRVYGFGGLYLGYLLSARIRGTLIVKDDFNPENSGTTEVDRNYTSDIDRFDFGAVMGLGADYALSKTWRLFLDGRFNWGWANVAQQGQGKIFNNVWTINLGLLYRLNTKAPQ